MSHVLALATGVVIGFLAGAGLALWGISCSRYWRQPHDDGGRK